MKKPSKNWPKNNRIIKYLDIGDVYLIHEKMIEVGGGQPGIRDFTLLHAAVERPKTTFANKELYPNLWLKTAALIHSLIKNHPFYDANKRTGYFSAMRFLKINDYNLSAGQRELIEFVLLIAIKNLSLNQIASWLKRHCGKEIK